VSLLIILKIGISVNPEKSSGLPGPAALLLKSDLIFAVAKDITEKKKLEVLLNKSNRLSGVGSWEIDVLNGTVFWSDITKEIREVDLDFVPDLSMGISYFKEGDSRNTISNLVIRVYRKRNTLG